MLPLASRQRSPANTMTFEEIEHELKTPLAAMRSLSELMRDYPDLADEQRRQFLEAIVRESERLSDMIDLLLGSRALKNGVS